MKPCDCGQDDCPVNAVFDAAKRAKSEGVMFEQAMAVMVAAIADAYGKDQATVLVGATLDDQKETVH